jgi:hypothetical protein
MRSFMRFLSLRNSSIDFAIGSSEVRG